MIERMTAIVNSRSDMDFQLLSITRLSEALDDIIALKADTVIIDTTLGDMDGKMREILDQIHETNAVQKCLVLADQIAAYEKISGVECVLYDDCLTQLFNRLSDL